MEVEMEEEKKKKEEKIDEIRRNLIKMGIWSIPIIIAFTSKKLWAGTPGGGPKGNKKEEEFFEEEDNF
jgi:hypothetical protein